MDTLGGERQKGTKQSRQSGRKERGSKDRARGEKTYGGKKARGRGVCGGRGCVKGSSTTPLHPTSFPVSGASSSSVLPLTPPSLLIRLMVTD